MCPPHFGDSPRLTMGGAGGTHDRAGGERGWEEGAAPAHSAWGGTAMEPPPGIVTPLVLSPPPGPTAGGTNATLPLKSQRPPLGA